jgi:hypothetical protein
MKMIKSVEEIKKIEVPIYVRWSKSIALDAKRGYSLRYGTQAEAGISACEINKSWEDWRILRQLQEYCFLGGSCWIVTGRKVGKGGDNEPLLKNIRCLGKVSRTLTNANWEEMKRVSDLAELKERLSRITDKSAMEIIQKDISRLEKPR